MSAPVRRLLFVSLLFASSLAAAGFHLGEPVPVEPIDYGPVANWYENLTLVTSGDRVLASCGGSSVRLDHDGDPLDVPPLRGFNGCDAFPAPDGWLSAVPEYSIGGLVLRHLPFEGPSAERGRVELGEFGRLLEVAASTDGVAVLLDSSSDLVLRTFTTSLVPRGRSTLQGRVLDLAAAGSTVAILFADRVVLTDFDARILSVHGFLPGFEARAVAPYDDGFIIAAAKSGTLEILRVGGGRGVSSLARLALPAAWATKFSVAAGGDSILVSWKGLAHAGSERLDLFVVRIGVSGMVVEGPVAIREGVDRSSHAFGATAVAASGDGWLVGWVDGGYPLRFYTQPGTLRTLRIGRSEPLDALADDVDVATWGALGRRPVAIARSGDVTLAVWEEEQVRGARFDATGRRLDPHDVALPPLETPKLVARDGGFLFYGFDNEPDELAAYPIDLEGNLGPPMRFGLQRRASIACAGPMCLLATTHPEDPANATVRVTRIAGSDVLDPGGIPVAFHAAERVELATDGERFLVAWARNFPEGSSIVSAALVDPRGGLEYRTFDIAAPLERVSVSEVGWDGEWIVLASRWSSTAARLIRLRRDGAVIDGDESAWRGWEVDIPGSFVDLVRACGRTVQVVGAWPALELWEIGARTAIRVESFPTSLVLPKIACAGTCLVLAGESSPQPWWDAAQVYAIPLGCRRERPVSRP